MPGRKRRIFTEAQKADLVRRLLQSPDQDFSSFCRDNDIQTTVLSRWARQAYGYDGYDGHGVGEVRRKYGGENYRPPPGDAPDPLPPREVVETLTPDGWMTESTGAPAAPDGPIAHGQGRGKRYAATLVQRSIKAVLGAARDPEVGPRGAVRAVSDAIQVPKSTVADWMRGAGYRYPYRQREKRTYTKRQPHLTPAEEAVAAAMPPPVQYAPPPPPAPLIEPSTLSPIVHNNIRNREILVSTLPMEVVQYIGWLESEVERLSSDRETGIDFATMLATERKRRT